MAFGSLGFSATRFWRGDRKLMGKVSPYNLGNISVELEQFRDEITNLFNLGKHAPPIVTSPPTWHALPGEQAYYMPASGGTTLYFFKNSAWVSSWSVII